MNDHKLVFHVRILVLCLLPVLSIDLFAQHIISKEDVMRYKMVTVDHSLWCDPKKQDDVKKEIDRIVENGFNGISISTYKFMPIYFVDYSKTKYPEAQEYDSKKIQQNVVTLRCNIRLAKSKGIKLFVSRSYCHYAPYKFWKAHQPELNPEGIFTPLLEKAHQSDIYLKTLAGKDNIIPQQQWTNPVFRDFFLYSTSLMLDALPELDGFLNAYAEAAWTYDLKKLKESKGENWKGIVNYPATDSCLIDYANRLYQMLKEKRGDDLFFGLRDWYVKPDMLKRINIPSEKLVISVKYGGYDQPIINYPPWGKTLQDEGFSVIMDVQEYDAEHPHPLYWYDPDIIFPTFKNIYDAGFAGVMYSDFEPRGDDSPYNPIRLLTIKTVGAAIKKEKFTNDDAINFLKPFYGDGSADLLVSLKKVSIAQAELIKLCPAWFWQGDGLTPGGPQNLALWMLMDNPEAPAGMAFVRQNVVGVREYVNAFLSGDEVLKKLLAEWEKQNRKNPYDVIDLMLDCADDAIASAVQARKKAPAGAPFMQDIVASAVIHKQLVLRDVAFLKAAIAFYESGYQYDGKYNPSKEMKNTGIDKKDECVKELQNLIDHDLIAKKLCKDYAPRRRQTREKPGYYNQKKIAAVMGKSLDIPALDTQELNAMISIILKK